MVSEVVLKGMSNEGQRTERSSADDRTGAMEVRRSCSVVPPCAGRLVLKRGRARSGRRRKRRRRRDSNCVVCSDSVPSESRRVVGES